MSRAQLAMSFAETTIEWAQEKLELTDEEVGQAVGVSRKTVQRWKERERKHLEQLNQLRYLLQTSFRNMDAAQRWMHSPLPALQGRTPHFALVEGDVEALVKILGTLAAGAHR
jgi:uncharacterized protein (DUF2384 family)